MDCPRKILHVITRMDPGGSAESTASTACHFAAKGDRVTLFAGPSTGWDELRRRLHHHGVTLYESKTLRRGISVFRDAGAFFELSAFIRSRGFDIVHTHSSKGGVIGRWAAWLARRGGLPRIVHTPHGHVFYGYFGPVKTRLYLEIERFTARITDALIALTDTGVEEYRAFGVIPRGEMVAVPSGIDFDGIQSPDGDGVRRLRRQFGLGDWPVVGTVARLEPIKGVETLIRTVPMLSNRNVHALIVGDGVLRGELELLARTLGVANRVHFVGWQRPIEDPISCMDVFVQPSINEGMGRTLVTAIYLGNVCVATRVGGIPSLMHFAEPSSLVPPLDPGVLASAIDEALKNSGRDRTAARVRQREIRHTFSVDAMNARLERLYRALLE